MQSKPRPESDQASLSSQAATLPGQLWQHAMTRPNDVAIREKHLGIWQQVSWRDYLDHVRRFTMGLLELGVKPGDAVAVQAENCQEWLYSDLAVQCAGAVVTTVYPTSSLDEVRHTLVNSGARILIAGDQEHLDKALALREQGLPVDRIIMFDPKGAGQQRGNLVLSFKEVQALGASRDAAEPGGFEKLLFAVQPGSLYDIMYTSGTSGPPKGALCVQRGAVEGARAMLACLPINAEDEWLSYLPLSHAFERIMAIAVHLNSGCVVNFADSIDTVQQDVAEIQPTVFGAVPRVMEKIRTSVEIRMGKSTPLKKALYRWAVATGQARVARQRKNIADIPAVPARQPVSFADAKPMATRWTLRDRIGYWLAYWLVLRHLKKHMGFLHTRYLLCGAAPMSAELFEYFMALGIPIINAFGMTELHNVPSGSRPGHDVRGTVGHVFPGWEAMKTEEGELLLRGPFGFCGYKGQESDPFGILDAQGWLHTGDLCQIHCNGYISIVGRKKDVLITSGGKNISPEIVENSLKASPYIGEAIVVGDGRHYLTALIELDAEAVGDFLQQRGISYTTLRDMACNPEVLRLVRQEVAQANTVLASVETVKKFAILPRDLSHDDGEMTPTRKVKRAQMEKQFRDLIEAMYAQDEEAIASSSASTSPSRPLSAANAGSAV